jgi:hypothetical protein
MHPGTGLAGSGLLVEMASVTDHAEPGLLQYADGPMPNWRLLSGTRFIAGVAYMAVEFMVAAMALSRADCAE